MKTILSALVALVAITAVTVPANALDTKKFFEELAKTAK